MCLSKSEKKLHEYLHFSCFCVGCDHKIIWLLFFRYIFLSIHQLRWSLPLLWLSVNIKGTVMGMWWSQHLHCSATGNDNQTFLLIVSITDTKAIPWSLNNVKDYHDLSQDDHSRGKSWKVLEFENVLESNMKNVLGSPGMPF